MILKSVRCVFASTLVVLQMGVAIAQPQELALMQNFDLVLEDEVPIVLQQRGVVRVGRLRLPGDVLSTPGDEPVPITVDENRSVNLIENSRRATGHGKTVVDGVIEGEPFSHFTMFLQNGVLDRGDIRMGDVVVKLTAPERVGADLVFWMQAVDPRTLPDELEALSPNVEPTAPPDRRGREGPVGLPIDDDSDDLGNGEEQGFVAVSAPPMLPVVVDVLVVYTEKAREAAEKGVLSGGMGQPIEKTISDVVDGANFGFDEQAGVTLNLVAMTPVDYVETNSIAEDLVRLACPCDHRYDHVGSNNLNEVFQHWKKPTDTSTQGVDLVSLWIDSPSGEPGITFDPVAAANDVAKRSVSVVHWASAVFSYSFDHEIGHNFYALHDRAQEYDVAYDYNYGFANLDFQVVTIMAYRSTCESFGVECSRIGYWSDPNEPPANSLGLASGPLAAHNARTLNEKAGTVSALSTQSDMVGCCVNHGNWLHSKYAPGKCQ